MPENENPNREKAIFEAALELPSPAERTAFLKGACGGDAELHERIAALLHAHESAAGFLPDAPRLPATAIVPVTEKPGDRIGRYKLRERLGEGGCGVVYVAEQEEPVRRRVAIKVIKLGMDTRSVVARFEAERQALAMMDHPNIAKVLDAGATDTGRPYFVMELVRGIKITDYCDQNNLSTRARLDLFIKVCQAVQHAHQKGIIHRDLKPSNILVTLHDGVPVPKVIDFGIAKATEGRLTHATVYTELHQFIGTPAYMSPEQAEMSGLDIDTRSDIYSLGVLLYELLTGKTPFDARELWDAGLEAMRRTIREVEPVKPSTRLTLELARMGASQRAGSGVGGKWESEKVEGEAGPREQSPPPTFPPAHFQSGPRRDLGELQRLIPLLRGDLDWVVMKALEKDRTRRYETATGFAQDIQRHLSNEPVVARPPSALYRLQKLARRNQAAFAATTAVAAALVIGISVSVWQAVRASRESGAARRAEAAARSEAQRADQAAGTATNALLTANERMVKLNVAEGWRRVEEGDHFGALLPFAEAFALEQDKPDRAEIHQMRLASVLQHCPKLVNVWSVGLHHRGEFNKDGLRLLTTGSFEGKSVARVWDSATGQPLTRAMPHEKSIEHIQWSDDETKVATTSWDKTARVWDAKTGRPLTPPLQMDSPVIWADFNSSGTRLVTVGWKGSIEDEAKSRPDGQLAVWDVSTGKSVWITNAPILEIQDFALFTPGDEQIVTSAEVRRASDGSIIRKLELYSQKLRAGQTATWDQDWPVNSHRVAFSSDASRLFIAPSPVRCYYDRHSREAQAVLLDGQTFDRKIGKLTGSERLRLAKFSWSGHRLATADEGYAARVWDSATGAALTSPMRHAGSISSLTFSRDGRQLATTTATGFARTWNADTGEPSSPPLPHGSALVRAAFSADGHQLHVFGYDGIVRTWDLRSVDVPRFSWRGSGGDSPVVNPDSNAMMVLLSGEFPAIHSLRSGEPIFPPLRPPDYDRRSWEWDAGFSSDGKVLFGPQEEVETSLNWVNWSLATGEVSTNSVDHSRTWKLVGGVQTGTLLDLSSDRRFVVSSGKRSDGEAVFVVREVAGNRVVIEEPLADFSFSADGRRAIGQNRDGTLMVWSMEDGLPVLKFGDEAPGRYARASSADGTRHLTRSKDRLELWNTETGERLAAMDADHGCLSEEGEWMATAKGRRVSLHSIAHQSVLVTTFLARMKADWGMKFSPDSRLLLVRDPLGGLQVWSVPDGELVAVRKLGKDDTVLFGPDSRSLLVSLKGGGVQYWPLLEARRSARDWLAIIRLFSGEQSGRAVSTNQSLVADWRDLSQILPDALLVTADILDAWERHEALRCESAKDWFNAVVHLSALLETHPDSGDFLPRRAAACVAWADALVAADVRRLTAPNSAEKWGKGGGEKRGADAVKGDSPSPLFPSAPLPTNQMRLLTSGATNLWERALADYSRTLAWVDRYPAIARESRKPFLEERRKVFIKLGREAEAQADEREIKQGAQE